MFTGSLSYLFDTIESGQFLFPIASYMGFIPYIAVFLCDAFQVLDGDLALGLHIAFAFLSPIYIPFGVIQFTSKKYLVCSIMKNCDTLTVSDYMETEIWVLYLAIAFHTLLWGTVLKVADFKKDGGKLSDLFGSRRAVDAENVDAIENEDGDVKTERSWISDYFGKRQLPEKLPVIAVQGLRKEFTSGVNTKAGCRKGSEEANKKVAVR